MVMVHTQKSFLLQLKLILTCCLPSQELQTVMEDYEGFFADRLQEGRSEGEICQSFGSPRRVAQNILQETKWNPAGLLAFLCTFLAGVFNGEWFWTQFFGFRNRLSVLYLLQLVLIPVLWLRWRKEMAYPPAPASKKWLAILCGAPTVVWTAVYGYTFWLTCVWLPRCWQVLPEAERLNRAPAQILHLLLPFAIWILLIMLLAALLWTWWAGTPQYLPCGAWCIGCMCSLTRIWRTLTNMALDAHGGYTSIQSETLLPPLLALAVVGVGGASLTAFLVWKILVRKGGSHGHTA